METDVGQWDVRGLTGEKGRLKLLPDDLSTGRGPGVGRDHLPASSSHFHLRLRSAVTPNLTTEVWVLESEDRVCLGVREVGALDQCWDLGRRREEDGGVDEVPVF